MIEKYRPKWIKLAAAFFCIFLFGTLWYYFMEDGWTLLDALYMVAISVTTVGYSVPHSLSPQGRIFTIILIFMGLGVAAASMAHFTKFLIEGELKGLFRRKKVQNKIKKIRKHYIVCGHGRTGATICLKLFELNIPFVIIDSETEPLNTAEQRGFLAVKGNAGSDMTLLAAGIERAAGLVICCSDDGTSLLIALAGRELNPDIYIISLGSFPTNETRMIRAGANTVVYPLRLGGEQIAQLIAKQCGTTFETGSQLYRPGLFGYDLRLFNHFDEKVSTISEILSKYKALQAVGIKRNSGEIIDDPPLDTEVRKDDSVILLVRDDRNIDVTQPEEGKKIIWSDKYCVGVNAIDDDHRSLVILVNRFNEAFTSGSGKLEIASVFDKLLEYTVNHFQKEENIMKKYNYPEMTQHIQKHRDLTKEVMAFNKGKQYVFPENIAEFLNSWLMNHIMETDKKLGAFLTGTDIH